MSPVSPRNLVRSILHEYLTLYRSRLSLLRRKWTMRRSRLRSLRSWQMTQGLEALRDRLDAMENLVRLGQLDPQDAQEILDEMLTNLDWLLVNKKSDDSQSN